MWHRILLLAIHANDLSPMIAKDGAFQIAKSPGILCTITATPTGLRKIDLQLSSSFCCILSTPYFEKEILSWLVDYSRGHPSSPTNLPFDLGVLSPFQKSVLQEMQNLAYGTTVSYKDLAKCIGCPQGARAIGNACNKNPLPLVIPCHRIIASDGTIGGFGYGIEMKTRLLNFENSSLYD